MIGSTRAVVTAKAIPSPIASYGFAAGSGATTVDSSGNGRTLTLNNAAWAAGHTGFGLSNTGATTGAASVSTFTAPATALTIMAWIRPLDLTAGSTHFAAGFIDTGGSTCAAIFTQRGDFGTSNVLQCDIRLGGSLVAFHGPALTLNTWTHIAMTYSGANTVIYKDGVVVGNYAATGTVAPGDGFFVAGSNPASLYDTDVDVDDVRVFNRALSIREVKAAMTLPVA